MEDRMGQKIGGTENVSCLPHKRKMGKQDIDQKILVERNTGVIPTKHAEEKVRNENTENDWCCVEKAENGFVKRAQNHYVLLI